MIADRPALGSYPQTVRDRIRDHGDTIRRQIDHDIARMDPVTAFDRVVELRSDHAADRLTWLHSSLVLGRRPAAVAHELRAIADDLDPPARPIENAMHHRLQGVAA